MALLIPFDPRKSSDQKFKVDLGGAVVSIRIIWNTREKAWFMDVEGSGTPARSVKLVPNSPLLHRIVDLGVEGNFYVLRTDVNAQEPIGFFELGKTWGIYWLSWSELDGI